MLIRQCIQLFQGPVFQGPIVPGSSRVCSYLLEPLKVLQVCRQKFVSITSVDGCGYLRDIHTCGLEMENASQTEAELPFSCPLVATHW